MAPARLVPLEDEQAATASDSVAASGFIPLLSVPLRSTDVAGHRVAALGLSKQD